MPVLADAEIRRLMKFLRGVITDPEKISFVEDELRGDFGAEFLREPEIVSYFPTETFEIAAPETIWHLKIISYTRMRMIQRGIGVREIVELFERFLRFCAAQNQIITVGAYTIFGKTTHRSAALTLRIDVNETAESENKAHTVTVFIGRGDTAQTVEINLIS